MQSVEWLGVKVSRSRYRAAMTAAAEGDPASYEVIHLGGEAAAIVPLADLRRLQAVQRHASPDLLEQAEIETTLTAHREWVAAGRHGAVAHEKAMAELLGEQCGLSGPLRRGLPPGATWPIKKECG